MLGFGATGYAADVLQESLRADVNIVETVAHMMSAVHFFGDVDVICDIGGQDIKVLFMKNGDIANFRLSNSVLGRQRHAAAGDGRPVRLPVTEYADTAFGAELAPKFSYGCAVFLDTDRVNFQKEGFSKEELLAGPRAGAAEERLAVRRADPALASLGRKFVLQGGTQYNLAASRRRSTTSRSACPTPRSTCTRTRARRAPSARRSRRCAWSSAAARARSSASTRRSRSSTTTERRETVCHFCPNECKRTFIDTQAPDGSTSRYISGFSCEKGTVESEEAMLALVRSARRSRSSSRTSSTTRRSWLPHFYEPAPMPARAPVDDVEVKKGLFGIKKRRHAAVPRAGEASWKLAAKSHRIGMPRVLNMYSTGPSGARTSRRSASPSRTSSSATTRPRRCGSRAASTARSTRATRRRWRRRTSTTCCSTTTPTRSRSTTSSSRPHARAELRRGVMDKTSCPIVAGVPEVMKARSPRRSTSSRQRGIEYLDPRSPSPR
jgi:hypothetical protein